MSTIEAKARLFYAADVQACSRAQLAALIRGDIEITGLGAKTVKKVLEELATDEARARGITLPLFWALTSPD